MKKAAVTIGILLLAGVLVYPAFARGPGWGSGCPLWGYGSGPGTCWQGYSGQERLSQDQNEKLDALDRKFFRETEALRSEIWTKQTELNAQFNAPNPNEARIRSLQGEINTLKNQMADKQLDYRLESRKAAPYSDYFGNMGRYPGGCGRFRGDSGPGRCWN